MRISINSIYDRLVASAAKNWRYRPANLNGVPVKYRKAIQISLKASNEVSALIDPRMLVEIESVAFVG